MILGVILLLLAAGVIAWASERFAGANAPRVVSVAAFVVGLAWAVGEWLGGPDATGLYAAQNIAWIPRFGISVALSMDGLSLLMVALTMFLGIVAVV